MNKGFKWILPLAVILVAVLTNPKKQDHVDKIKEKLTEKLSTVKAEGKNDYEIAGEVIGWNIGMAYVENIVSVDNYLLFSLTRITYDGKSRIVGIGAFGNVWLDYNNDN